MQIYIDVFKLNKNLFLDVKTRQGRGDISKLRINKKKIFLLMKVTILIPIIKFCITKL